MWYPILITALVGYMLGNLNGAVCISALQNDDVRSHGSGNAGLTNFVRNFGAVRGIFVILIDGGKAVLACLTGALLLKDYGPFQLGATIGGLAVMLGHDFPALLGFKGGKGILSALFIGLTVDWRIAAIGLSVFIVLYVISGYVSLGSIGGAVTYLVCFVVFYHWYLPVMICGVVMSSLAVIMHHGNIVRLIKGTERRTNLFAKKKAQE